MTYLVRGNRHVMCKAETVEEAEKRLQFYKRAWAMLGGDDNVQWNIVEMKD